MTTYKVTYIQKEGRCRTDYMDAEDITEAILKFTAEMVLGGHKDIWDGLKIREVTE